MAARGTVRVSITGETGGLDRATRRAESDISRFGRSASGSVNRYGRAVKSADDQHQKFLRGSGRIRTSMGALFLGGGVFAAGATAVYGLAHGIQYMAEQFGESQKVGAQTRAAIKSTGGAAKVSEKQINDLAQALSRKSGVDDETVQSGENLLLTFTRIRNETGKGNDIFNQASRVILDVSTAMGQDLKSSAIQVGKALSDPVRGMTALRRIGVTFTDSQAKTIKSLVDSGHLLDAQKLILRELNKEFGGSAKAYGQTLPGALGKFKTQLGNVAETLGGKLAPFLLKGMGLVKGFVHEIQAGTGVGGKFRSAFGSVIGTLGQFVRQIRTGTGFGGQLRTIISSLAGTVRGLAQALFPVVRGLVQAAIHVGAFAVKIASSRAGLVALHAILGAIVGRLAGLAAAWAVARVAAFVGAIAKVVSIARGLVGAFGAARGAAIALTTAIRANPFTVIGAAIGVVVGVLSSLSGGQRRARVSARQLSDALRDQRDALRALRDVDLDSAEAKTRNRAATIAVRTAEARLKDLRHQGRKGTLDYKQAEVDLEDARNEQKRAQRDLSDQEQHGKDVREDATKATKASIKTARDRISTLQQEITRIKGATAVGGAHGRQLADLRAKEAQLSSAQSTLNRLLAQSRGAAAGARNSFSSLGGVVSGVRSVVSGLNAALDNLNGKHVNTFVTEHHSSTRRRMEAPDLGGFAGGFGGVRGTPGDLTPTKGGPAGMFGKVAIGAGPGGFPSVTGLLGFAGSNQIGTRTGRNAISYGGLPLSVREALFGAAVSTAAATPGTADDAKALNAQLNFVGNRIRNLRKKFIPADLKRLRSKSRKTRAKGMQDLVNDTQELASRIDEYNGIAQAIAELGQKPDTGDTGNSVDTVGGDTGPSPDDTAALNQLESQLAVATRRGDINAAAVRAFGSKGDIGTGTFKTAYDAGVNVTIQSLHPSSPQVLKEVAGAVATGLSFQPAVVAPRVATGA